MYVCTHSHSLRRKTTFREYYTHSRALTLTQRHRHGHWQRLTPAAAQRFDGPKNNNKNNNEQCADRAELQNGSARRKVKNTTETSLGEKYFYSTLGSAWLDGGTRNRPTMGLSLVWLCLNRSWAADEEQLALSEFFCYFVLKPVDLVFEPISLVCKTFAAVTWVARLCSAWPSTGDWLLARQPVRVLSLLFWLHSTRKCLALLSMSYLRLAFSALVMTRATDERTMGLCDDGTIGSLSLSWAWHTPRSFADSLAQRTPFFVAQKLAGRNVMGDRFGQAARQFAHLA